VWREHPGAGPGIVENRDSSVTAGSYRLEVACTGGSIGVNIGGERAKDIECSSQVDGIPVCITKSGLTVSAEWIRGPFDDLAWQLVDQSGSC
jgi:hypothetical protein